MRKFLYLISDTGGGHRVAARAVVSTMQSHGANKDVHEIIDVFTMGNFFVNWLFGKTYGPMISRIPWMYEFLFYTFNNPFLFYVAFWANYFMLGPQIEKFIKKFQPDVIVSLHPLANHLIVRVLKHAKLFGKIPIITVVLDPITLHRSWICADVDKIVVATEEARDLTISYGMPPEEIVVIGLPVDPKFSLQSPPQEEIRKKIGLEEKTFTIMLMGGGDGMGNLEKFTASLYYSGLPIQLIVVAGRNRKLQSHLEEMAKEGEIPLKVFGYTQDVPDLMAGSDLLLTKAGPGSIAEALLKEIPVIIISYVPGQEEGNVRWVEEEKFGKLVEDPTDVPDIVENLMVGDNLQKMRDTMRTIKRPNAAHEIVELILKFTEKKKNE